MLSIYENNEKRFIFHRKFNNDVDKYYFVFIILSDTLNDVCALFVHAIAGKQ